MKKAGITYNGRLNPIAANTKPFKSLKVPWKYDADAFNAVLLLGLTFALLPYGFSIEVVKNRQVFFELIHIFVISIHTLSIWMN